MSNCQVGLCLLSNVVFPFRQKILEKENYNQNIAWMGGAREGHGGTLLAGGIRL